MPEPIISDLKQALDARVAPTITMWNRLEGRPRTHDFDRTMRAPIHDALWMISRQWQVGEFKGEDAGSPVFAKLHVENRRLEAYRAGDAAPEPFDYDLPLEAQVEARPIAFAREGHFLSLDLRLLMGRHWLKLIAPLGPHRDEYIARYPVRVPDPADPAVAPVCSDPETWQHVAAVAERAMDGYALYLHLEGGGVAHDGTSIAPGDADGFATRFLAWFERQFHQPEVDRAWQPDSLDYRFAISTDDTAEGAVLRAESYHHGDLEWYHLDVDKAHAAPGVPPHGTPPGLAPRPTSSFIPTQLTFEGVPNSRWWTFEDGRTNLGNVKLGTKDLAKLILIDFALIQGNDWFLFPLTLPVGSTTRIRGLAVTSVFGERTWIEAAGRGQDEAWERWNMYTLSVAGTEDVTADMRYLLLPTVPKVQQGAPVEEVAMIRDEMANMVWAIEARVPMPHGRSRPGYEAAMDLHRFHERLVSQAPAPEPPPAAAAVGYRVMSNNVPGNWIPFIPVHVPADNRRIQLQRAALPRIVPRDPKPPVKIRPRTGLVGVGRECAQAYVLHEEEVPRAGVHLTQRFQRTRWMGGLVVTWLGVEKQTGRGEGASNIRFDFLTAANAVASPAPEP